MSLGFTLAFLLVILLLVVNGFSTMCFYWLLDFESDELELELELLELET